MHVKLIVSERKDAPEPLFLLEKRGADVDEARFQHGAYLGFNLVYRLARIAVPGQIQTDFKDALLRLFEGTAQILKVGICGIKHRVAHHALLFARGYLALNLGDFLLEFPEHFARVHRMNEYGNVQNFVHVDNRREPSRSEKTRIRDYEKGAR